MSTNLIIGDTICEAVLTVVAVIWFFGADGLRGTDRFPGPRNGVPFFAGLLIAAIVISPPLDQLGAHLFSMHMLQHLLLILGAGPLLAQSRPAPVVAAVLPIPELPIKGVEAAWAAAALFSVTILIWHLPIAHDWALADPLAHAVEHLSVLAAAVIFWTFVVFARDALERASTIIIVWLISLQGAMLSAVIMFAPTQLCGSYAGNPLTDQVGAGLLMCIPASLAYAGSSIWALARLIGERAGHVS